MKTITCPNCSELINVTARKKSLQNVPASVVDIHTMVSSMLDVQGMRMMFANRNESKSSAQFNYYIERLESLENRMKDDIEQKTKEYPITSWLIDQPGISYDIAGQIIGVIQDIGRFGTVSKLWTYLGLSPVDECTKCKKYYFPTGIKEKKVLNIAKRLQEQSEKRVVHDDDDEEDNGSTFTQKAQNMLCSCESPILRRVTQKRKKGYLGDFSPEGKTLMLGKVAKQFIMAKHPVYKKIYDESKAEYSIRPEHVMEINAKKGKVTKFGVVSGTAHVDRKAQRKMIKIFVENLWVTWRTMENLPVTKPYPIAILGHQGYIENPKKGV